MEDDMLGLVFGLVLATSGLNDPGLHNKGLDGRTPQRPPMQVAETVEPAAGDALPGGDVLQAARPLAPRAGE
jgi:hypothetical protein